MNKHWYTNKGNNSLFFNSLWFIMWFHEVYTFCGKLQLKCVNKLIIILYFYKLRSISEMDLYQDVLHVISRKSRKKNIFYNIFQILNIFRYFSTKKRGETKVHSIKWESRYLKIITIVFVVVAVKPKYENEQRWELLLFIIW